MFVSFTVIHRTESVTGGHDDRTYGELQRVGDRDVDGLDGLHKFLEKEEEVALQHITGYEALSGRTCSPW
jgi:hypothetical protein